MTVVIPVDIQCMLQIAQTVVRTNDTKLSWPIANLMNFTIDLHPLETARDPGTEPMSPRVILCHPVSCKNAVCNDCDQHVPESADQILSARC